MKFSMVTQEHNFFKVMYEVENPAFKLRQSYAAGSHCLH